MCYSAKIIANYRKYVREHGAYLDIHEWYDLFERRTREAFEAKLPKATEMAFAQETEGQLGEIAALIRQYNSSLEPGLQEKLFEQKKRLADAERKLAVKSTKKAAEDQRIATNKIGQFLAKLHDLRRTELNDSLDVRIFPGSYAPVMVWEDGRRIVKPMRFHCRPAGMPASSDKAMPGNYNARRDNLKRFWRNQYGHTHAVIEITTFFENVDRHRCEGRELRDGEEVENVVIEFNPQGMETMLLACLWSRWKDPAGGPDLLSFAFITDEPPPEVSAAGHDRCVIPLKPENVDAWLNPDPKNLAAMDAILDDRPRPYYEHQFALAA